MTSERGRRRWRARVIYAADVLTFPLFLIVRGAWSAVKHLHQMAKGVRAR